MRNLNTNKLHTEFTQSVLDLINKGGLETPEVICEYEDEELFGNASVTLELDGLRLHIVNDRGVQSVEVGLETKDPSRSHVHRALEGFRDGTGNPTCPLETLAAAKEWISVKRLIKHYDLEGREQEDSSKLGSVKPLLPLSDALTFLEDRTTRAQLVDASKNDDIQMRAGEIEQDLQNMMYTLLSGRIFRSDTD